MHFLSDLSCFRCIYGSLINILFCSFCIIFACFYVIFNSIHQFSLLLRWRLFCFRHVLWFCRRQMYLSEWFSRILCRLGVICYLFLYIDIICVHWSVIIIVFTPKTPPAKMNYFDYIIKLPILFSDVRLLCVYRYFIWMLCEFHCYLHNQR